VGSGKGRIPFSGGAYRLDSLRVLVMIMMLQYELLCLACFEVIFFLFLSLFWYLVTVLLGSARSI
jgi:hypothetical protein